MLHARVIVQQIMHNNNKSDEFRIDHNIYVYSSVFENVT